MRHILVILMMVFCAWAVLPAAAQAHGAPHGTAASTLCADCDHSAVDEREHEGCHHGAGCAVYGLPAGTASVTLDPGIARAPRCDSPAAPPSALVAGSLPPPRS